MIIELDNNAVELIEQRKIYDSLFKNNLSHFIEWTFRENIFNLKSFLTRDINKDELLYISVNLSSLIVKSFADFCYWDGIKIELWQNQEEWDKIADYNNIDNLFYWIFISQSKTWYAILRTRLEEWEVKIEEIPFDYYYPVISNLALWQEPIEHNIISFYLDNEWNKKANIQQYKLLDNWKWKYLNWIWTAEQWQIDIEQVITEEILDFLPIIRVDNQKIAGELFWRSDLEEILDLLEEINDRITQISVQFIKHLNSKIALPESMLEWIERAKEDWKINWIWELDTLAFAQWEQKPEYVENKNAMIKDWLDYIDRILKITASIVQIPTSFFWLEENGGAEKVEALRIRLMRFLKKVSRKQRMFEIQLKNLIKKSLQLKWYNTDNLEIDVKFTDWIQQTFEQKANTYWELYWLGLVSKETAIKNIFDYDDLFVQAELKKIDDENLLNNITTSQSILPELK